MRRDTHRPVVVTQASVAKDLVPLSGGAAWDVTESFSIGEREARNELLAVGHRHSHNNYSM